MVRCGTVEVLKLVHFEYTWYWNTLNDLNVDVEGCWKEDIRYSSGNRQFDRKSFKNGSGSNRIKLPIREKPTKYQDH
jgi:hypothetical protein